ncbi:phosphodiester glycosidase family protein [Rufibacter latericius]|uniref:T9SS C-terminal target domain-containing protein n=1 Tax=Rufibacter latericius TaxID=2487040 RepID=A0A3M9MLV7_9BACT|nr:phosphodiester glycosidase family protein [Rufibacter latericius]RNI26197.1 T9SS C-terminal target domain-containing protein [Rufibacter latericius]
MKTKVLSFRVLLLACAWLLLLKQPLHAQLQLNWTKPAEFNTGLPPSVQVFYSTSSVTPGVPLRMYYTLIDLNDPNLELKVEYGIGGLGASKTPSKWADTYKETVYAVINGGFFDTNTYAAIGTVVKDGKILAINPKSNGPAYPTMSAFGILPGNKTDLAWIYHVGAENTMFSYPNPNPVNQLTQQPTATYPEGATSWPAGTALGAGPMLVQNGEVRMTGEEELMWPEGDSRQPRSAIGRTADNKVILLAVEGRNDGISMGLSFPQMAQVLVSIGAEEAMNLDGGGSSAMIVNGKNTIRPSDGGVQRNVPNAFLLKRRTHVYDTENSLVYSERGGSWMESVNEGFYGLSKARIIPTGDGSKFATYKLTGIAPARYELSAWWEASSNGSSNTPYTIYRNGAASPETIQINQSINGGKFNVIGTFDLGPNDSLVISNKANGQYVTADAISLVKVGESMPSITFSHKLERDEVVQDRTGTFNVLLSSPNSGFTVQKLRVFKKVGEGSEEKVGNDISLDGKYNYSYAFSYQATDPLGSRVTFRFELEDSFGRAVSKSFVYNVVSLTYISLKNGAEFGKHPVGHHLSLEMSLGSKAENTTLKELRVFKSVDGSEEQQLGTTLSLQTQTQQDYTFNYKVTDAVNSKVNFRFELTDSKDVKANRTYQAHVVPARGDFRLAVISDLNSSFGAVTYEWQVDSIMQRIPRLWKPDMVVAGGDQIAGQSASLTPTQVEAMWNGFDAKIAKPLRDANIPYAFTMGNHDAAIEVDRVEAKKYWSRPENAPKWHPVDITHYPFYFSYKPSANSDIFFVSWEASSANISAEQLEWVRAQFSSKQAKAAKFRFLVGHLPLYGVAQEYNSAGNILSNAAALQAMMEELDVHTYISGHHHAYYPGKHGGVEFLNAGAAGSGPRKYLGYDAVAPNTVTLMDVFLEQDTIIYTTFDIKHTEADAMPVFNEKQLPEVIVGANGHLLRRDVPISGAGVGALSAYNKINTSNIAASGAVQATDMGATILISGSFANLQGTILPDRSSVALYQGLYPEQGALKLPLMVESTDGRNGTFSGSLPAGLKVKELMSMGALYVSIKTNAFQDGELRTQLYKSTNQGPALPVIKSHQAGTVYPIRDIKGFFSVQWGAEKDPEGNTITYTYQLAKDAQFSEMVLHKPVGNNLEYSVPQEEWFKLLGEARADQTVSFFHRVIASDGKTVSMGVPVELQVAKSTQPVTGPVEIPAPAFVYDCKEKDPDGNCIAAFAPAPTTNAHGVTVDKKGKVWAVGYARGVQVHNPDATKWEFTSDKLEFYQGNKSYIQFINFKGFRDEVRLVTGIGLSHDGNILVAFNTILYKLDVNTGEPLAREDTDISLTNPTSDKNGNIFVTSVTGNKSYIFRQSVTDPTVFENVATYADATALAARTSGAITRASAISPEGNIIYVPYISGNKIDKYTSTDGVTWTPEEPISIVSNSKSIYAATNSRMYAVVDASGDQPAKLIFRDDSNPEQKLSWTLPLPEIHGTDLRGLTLSPGLDTAYIVSSAVGTVYRYVLPSSEKPQETKVTLQDYTIAQARTVNESGVADHLGKYVRLKGVVNSLNLSRADYDFAIVDEDKGIQVYKLSKGDMNYTPRLGDKIAAIGLLRQYNGFLRLEIDSVRLIETNHAITTPLLVTALEEGLESFPVELQGVSLVDQSQWRQNVGYHGFSAQLQTSQGIIEAFVPSNSELFARQVPKGSMLVKGFVHQFKAEAPYTSGYYLTLTFVGNVTGSREELLAKEVQVYPVPTNGKLYLKVPENLKKKAEVQVVDLTGKTVVGKSKLTESDSLDLTHLPSGMYIVMIHTSEGKIFRRIVRN